MANSYLSRTFSGTPTMTTFTVSFWIKRATIGATQRIISARVDGNNESTFYFSSSDQLNISSTVGGATKCDIKANRLFKDTSAWYHIVVQKNTTLATANDRVKIWVNGVEETEVTRSTTQVQNEEDFFLKSTATHEIGRRPSNNDQNFSGYFTHFCVVQGSVVAPTSFGETDSTSGIWKFKSPAGISFGTNGFHLKFENAGALGTDSSGNSQTWTVNGNLKQALDTPSNLSCAWSSAQKDAGALLSTGATQMTRGSGDGHCTVIGTLGVSSGKWYYECKLDTAGSAANANSIGIVRVDSDAMKTSGHNAGDDSSSDYFYCGGAEYQGVGGSGSYGNSYTSGDIIGIAFDLDNNKLYFHKNGTYQNSGVPTSGSTGTGAKAITAGDFFVPACGGYDGTIWKANFGNGYFGTTAISSAGSNGNGSLFEYDVPSGYYALNTKNINTYG